MNEIFKDIEQQNQFPTHTGNQTYTPPSDELVVQNLKNWQNDKFGIIIHMGLYSQLGVVESWGLCPEDEDWIPRDGFDNYNEYAKNYKNTITQFNPAKLDSAKWAEAIKNSGANYVIFTSKHHDGFCLYDSKFTDFKITSAVCPYSKNNNSDILKNLINSFRKAGLKIGVYLSKPDWSSDFFWWKYFPPKDRNPNYDVTKHPDRWKNFVEFTHNQLKELTSNYGKIDILWLDGCWIRPIETLNESVIEFCRYPHDLSIDMDTIADFSRKNQPGLIIVDRWVQGEHENYLTPERKIPDKALTVPWESCITMGNAWGWVPDDKYKSAKELAHLLINIISKGGNLLLGIGPKGDGEFEEAVYERLKTLGGWIDSVRESIFNTTPFFPFKHDKIAYTRSHDSIYAFYIPDDSEPVMPKQIIFQLGNAAPKNVKILGESIKVEGQSSIDGYKITLPPDFEFDFSSKFAIVFKFSV